MISLLIISRDNPNLTMQCDNLDVAKALALLVARGSRGLVHIDVYDGDIQSGERIGAIYEIVYPEDSNYDTLVIFAAVKLRPDGKFEVATSNLHPMTAKG